MTRLAGKTAGETVAALMAILRRRSPLSSDHLWMAPAWQGLFVAFRLLVGCGHLFGVTIAAQWLGALMKVRVAVWVPINGTRSEALRSEQG
jgi:hypothetical protein